MRKRRHEIGRPKNKEAILSVIVNGTDDVLLASFWAGNVYKIQIGSNLKK